MIKPVALDRYIKACNRAKELYELTLSKTQTVASPPPDYFFLIEDYSQVKIMFNDITGMEGLRDYVNIHFKSSNKPLLFRTNLKALEPELPASKFIRIHKSYIIAIESIAAIRKTSVFIKDIELPIGEDNWILALMKFLKKEP